MTTQMIVRVDPDLKAKLAKLARAQGKNASQVVGPFVVIDRRDHAQKDPSAHDRDHSPE